MNTVYEETREILLKLNKLGHTLHGLDTYDYKIDLMNFFNELTLLTSLLNPTCADCLYVQVIHEEGLFSPFTIFLGETLSFFRKDGAKIPELPLYTVNLHIEPIKKSYTPIEFLYLLAGDLKKCVRNHNVRCSKDIGKLLVDVSELYLRF